jgi:hypothetical protein
MGTFGDFEKAVLSGAKEFAVGSLKDLTKLAEDDAQAFLKSSAQKLQRWTTMLASQQITKAEFAALVESQKALAQLDALTHAGIAAAALQRFRDGLIELVINAAFKTFAVV